MVNVIDYKKENKELYFPKTTPGIINVPEMNYVAIDGKGNPNDKNGEFNEAIPVLYSIQYTIKMSKKKKDIPEGYFDYVVPPLEGFWWVNDKNDIGNKLKYIWTIVIRLSEFVDKKIFGWACDEVLKNKKIDTEKAKYIKINESLCVQCMHIGPFDDEPKTIKLIDKYIEQNNLMNDINKERWHHEIYLSDFREIKPEKMKTVLRIPVKNK
ncbi:transcriptional regulator [Spirochaetia bacterium]|nr:transcriptional regulator [Spirochaetia bacterium]GHU36086.1 transcriptional regulator [Spirochaetia bacterium]